MQVRDRLAGALAAALLLVSLVTPATAAATGVKPPPKTQAGRSATSTAARAASGESRRATAQARKWMARMSLRERIAQLVMAPVYGDSPNARSREYREYLSLVAGVKVGGLVVLNRVRDGAAQRAEPHAAAAFLNRMQRLAKTPLIVAGGGVHYAEATGELARFAEAHGIPVAETQAGKSDAPRFFRGSSLNVNSQESYAKPHSHSRAEGWGKFTTF